MKSKTTELIANKFKRSSILAFALCAFVFFANGICSGQDFQGSDESDLDPVLGVDSPLVPSSDKASKKSSDKKQPDEIIEQALTDEDGNRSLDEEFADEGDRKAGLQERKILESRSMPLERNLSDRKSRMREKSLEEIDQEREVELFLKKKNSVRSDIETLFTGKYPGGMSRQLNQYGYEMFNRPAESFTPLENIPISSDYVVGPGDIFTVNIWGATNITKKIQVRRDGSVFVPRIGSLKVVGMTYSKLSQAIESRAKQLFSGVRVNLTFDSIRSVEVMVVGEVDRPGSYEIASTSSPINALFFSGGIKKTGSLRQVKVLRGGKEIAHVDLYDFLIKGSSAGVKLQSQDVVLVPIIGRVAGIAGNVKRPAIYELIEETTLYDLLQMAGGLSFSGHAGRLALERVLENKERVTKDILIPENFSSLNRSDALTTALGEKIKDGDFVRVFPVLNTMTQTIFFRGHVKRPGLYEFKPGTRVTDIIPNLEILKSEPYTEFIQIIRTVPPKDEKKSIFVNLDRALSGDKSQNIELSDRDQVVVFSKDQLNLREKVSISGRVNKPGSFYYFEGMRLRDLIYMAGNLAQDAYLANAEIARYRIENNQLQFERFQVNLKNLDSEDDLSNPVLIPKDNVLIQGIPNWELENFIEIEGEVKFPGKYSFSPKERLSSVLQRAGGFTDKSFLPGVVFTRASVKRVQEANLKEQIAKLEEAILQESIRPSQPMSSQDYQGFQEAVTARKALLKNVEKTEVSGRMVIRLDDLKEFKGGKFDILLEPGDKLFIPSTPSVVNVMGEVYNQTSLVYVQGKTVQYYLDQTGGLTTNADRESLFVIRADGSVFSKRQNRGFLLRDFEQSEIQRGDTILVPKDISRFSWLNTTKDITEILFKIASTTGITITALK